MDTGGHHENQPVRRAARRRVLALTAVVMLVTGIATALPSSAQEVLEPAAVTMTATPDTLLVQGDDVTVAGTGATPNSSVGISQCLAGATSSVGCTSVSGTNTSASGSFATVVTPRRILTVAGVAHDCADVGACELAAVEYDGSATIVAAAAIQFDPSIPPPPPPTLTATPSTGLVQGDTIDVAGTGFTPEGSSGLIQCVDATDPPASCDTSTVQIFQADGSGAFTRTFSPVRILFATNGTSHDCAIEACFIGGGSVSASGFEAQVSIQFDPNVPPPPAPSITVTPANGLADGQTVTVTGAGFQPGRVNVLQCGEPVGDAGENCELSDSQSTDVAADGTFRHLLVVNRKITTPAGDIDCTGTDACAVAAGTAPGRGDDTPIGFAAATTGGGTAARAVSGTPSYAG